MWTFKNGVSKIHVEISSMVYGVMEEEGLIITFPYRDAAETIRKMS